MENPHWKPPVSFGFSILGRPRTHHPKWKVRIENCQFLSYFPFWIAPSPLPYKWIILVNGPDDWRNTEKSISPFTFRSGNDHTQIPLRSLSISRKYQLITLTTWFRRGVGRWCKYTQNARNHPYKLIWGGPRRAQCFREGAFCSITRILPGRVISVAFVWPLESVVWESQWSHIG